MFNEGLDFVIRDRLLIDFSAVTDRIRQVNLLCVCGATQDLHDLNWCFLDTPTGDLGGDTYYSIHVPGWMLKWLDLITAHGSVSNEPGSVTWLATKYLKTVSWKKHTEELTTSWPQNISYWHKINTPSSYFIILMLHCLKNILKLQFDSYVTAVKFLTLI